MSSSSSSSSSTATVRQATRQDVPAILSLIKALAVYEKEPDIVEATVESLQSTIAFESESTSPSRPARCLLAVTPGGEAVGMALYFYNYSTWRSRPGVYLEDLFVQPSERGKGYGKRLLVELAKHVVAIDGRRLEWAVLKWNEPSIKFYESIGAQPMNEWMTMRVDGSALDKLAHLLD
ncbi:hypothetical protein L249_5003 [Ophiocordyceps polyrhachis-furcata BCC 54312]|uniref:N-acetyltransferase domain-containing protein n=1 Tax=Ophiocordyceps polyrhachis-furcata BCC 54312 TaxID=1330021 RepID=A0A367L349_9HYPO|nr:hypothetical protein L249_5003 [Ophiocordyceps polyrhachis-furcata BCC 54312]